MVFKYFDFFQESFVESMSLLGFNMENSPINLILPIGISFYTFQTLSYTIDVYRGVVLPSNNFLAFAAYVSFFPQLVAGPIERAKKLLPQFLVNREFSYNYAIDGCRQILWGFFKKIVLADTSAQFASEIFSNYENYSGSTLVLGAVFFSFQIYYDFSGYTDIAIGTARLFGFHFSRNFDYPYFSTSVTDFWRRWHISLSTWFRDYVYSPLVFKWRSLKKIGVYAGLFVTFLLMGLWHGAGWNFIVYGLIHGIVLIAELLCKDVRLKVMERISPVVVRGVSQFYTFSLVTFIFIFFKADSITHAINYVFAMFSNTIFATPQFLGRGKSIDTIVLIMITLVVEWIGKEGPYGLKNSIAKCPRFCRIVIYYSLLFLIIGYSSKDINEFIYFQF